MEEPNGQRVTGAQVYKALFEVRGEMLEQFGLLQERLNLADARVTQVTGRVDDHISNHPPAKPSVARVGGISGVVAAVVTAATALIYGLIRRGI